MGAVLHQWAVMTALRAAQQMRSPAQSMGQLRLSQWPPVWTPQAPLVRCGPVHAAHCDPGCDCGGGARLSSGDCACRIDADSGCGCGAWSAHASATDCDCDVGGICHDYNCGFDGGTDPVSDCVIAVGVGHHCRYHCGSEHADALANDCAHEMPLHPYPRHD